MGDAGGKDTEGSSHVCEASRKESSEGSMKLSLYLARHVVQHEVEKTTRKYLGTVGERLQVIRTGTRERQNLSTSLVLEFLSII